MPWARAMCSASPVRLGKFVERSYVPPMPPHAHTVACALMRSACPAASNAAMPLQRWLPAPFSLVRMSLMRVFSRMRTLPSLRTAASSFVVISAPVVSSWKQMRARLCAPSRV